MFRDLWDLLLLHSVKTYHSDWFHKELNGQYLGRKRFVGPSGDREVLEKKKGKVVSQT